MTLYVILCYHIIILRDFVHLYQEPCWQVVSVQRFPGPETSENIPKHGGVLLLNIIYQYSAARSISGDQGFMK